VLARLRSNDSLSWRACLSICTGGLAIITVNGKTWLELDWRLSLDNLLNENPDCQLEDEETIPYLTQQNIDGKLLLLRRAA